MSAGDSYPISLELQVEGDSETAGKLDGLVPCGIAIMLQRTSGLVLKSTAMPAWSPKSLKDSKRSIAE